MNSSTPPIGILLDITENGKFLCQLRYTKRGFPEMIDGRLTEVHDIADIQKFVFQQRPFLRHLKIRIEFAKQRVFR